MTECETTGKSPYHLNMHSDADVGQKVRTTAGSDLSSLVTVNLN